MKVALLAGGTGGARLAAGMQDLIGDELSVIANTADDIETLGVYVSPDPDLITYWLSGEIDTERGWGIQDDEFNVFERMNLFGAPSWFQLSDRDLATCLYRRLFLDEGGRVTDAQAQIAGGLGAKARVLPMSDQPVRTRVLCDGGWRQLQEYLILDHGMLPVDEVDLQGIEDAEATPEVLSAIEEADIIVIGPSNPVISIGPILAVSGIRDAITRAAATVVAVSPYVDGRVVKGPTDHFMGAIGRPSTASGVASLYADLIDGMLIDTGDPDDPPDQVPTKSAPILMSDRDSRARVALATIEYAFELRDKKAAGADG